jgi:hypothetical protein
MRRTKTVYKGKVDGRAGCRAAAPVEEGLRIERGTPAEKVDPAKDGGQEREEANHDDNQLYLSERHTRTHAQSKREREEEEGVSPARWIDRL